MNRTIWFDYLRALAIITVVICHSVELTFGMTVDKWYTLSIEDKLFYTSFYPLGRLGVPLFLFLTASLILTKNMNKGYWKIFYKNNLLKLFIVIEVWVIIYQFVAWVINDRNLNFDNLIYELLLLKKAGGFGHMWYMRMILIYYILIPFIIYILRNIKQSIQIPIYIFYLYSLYSYHLFILFLLLLLVNTFHISFI